MGDVTGDPGGWLHCSTTGTLCLPRHSVKVERLLGTGLLTQEVLVPSPVFKTLILSQFLFPKLCISHFQALPAVLATMSMPYCSSEHRTFTSIASHVHNWVLFLLWHHLFLLSGVISPLISSSVLGTYWPGEFIFQCPIFLPFHTVHGVLKARILKWFAIPFSSGPHFVRTLHDDPSVLDGPTWHGL